MVGTQSLLLQDHDNSRSVAAPAPLMRRPQVPAAAQQLTQVLSKLRHTFVVADATLPDCPLVFASES